MASIIINDVKPRIQIVAAAAQTVYPYDFPIFDETDIKVYSAPDGAATNDSAYILTIGSQYTVTGVGVATGGTVVLVIPSVVDTIITIIRDMPIQRLTNFIVGGTLTADNLNLEFDTQVLFDQDNEMRKNALAPTYQNSELLSSPRDLVLPRLTANHIWQMKADGTGLESVAFDATDSATVLRADLASNSVAKGASLVGNDNGGTVQDFIDSVSPFVVGEDQTFYFGKGGDDDEHSGTQVETRLLTLGAAITKANAASPASGNRIVIRCQDAGTYAESGTLVAYVSLFAPAATITGDLALAGEQFVVLDILGGTGTDSLDFSTSSGELFININQILHGSNSSIKQATSETLSGRIGMFTVGSAKGIDDQSLAGGTIRLGVDDIQFQANNGIAINGTTNSNILINSRNTSLSASETGTIAIKMVGGKLSGNFNFIEADTRFDFDANAIVDIQLGNSVFNSDSLNVATVFNLIESRNSLGQINIDSNAANVKLNGSNVVLTATNGVSVGGATPASSVLFDVNSTTQASMPIPRLTDIQINAIPNPLASMQAYDRDVDKIKYYNGAGWIEVGAANTNKNLLIAADFPVAPWQRGITFTAATTPANNDDTYLADRWILLSDGNNVVEVNKGSNGALEATVKIANKKFGFLQILENKDSIDLEAGIVSARLRAKVTSLGLKDIRIGVLKWTGTADVVTSDVVSTWNIAGTDPTLIANWSYLNTPTPLVLTSSYQELLANNITVDAGSNNVAIFVYTDDLTTTINDTLHIDKVKLEPGNSSTDFLPEKFADTIHDCQRYCQKTYNLEDIPGTITLSGSVHVYVTLVSQTEMSNMRFPFMTRMRTIPTITVYSTGTGAAGFVRNATSVLDEAVSTIDGAGETDSGHVRLTAGSTKDNELQCHFLAEAEL